MNNKQYDSRSIKLGHEVEIEINGEKIKVPSKSQAIIELYKAGASKGDIAKALDIRYQFVYNVISRMK